MDNTLLQPVQGMSDVSGPEIALWQAVERKSREVLRLYGFTEVRTPLVEYAGVFQRSLGETTDVVQKEMYLFDDRGGRQLALRPEGTASVMRFVAAGGSELADARLYYIGPMFRCERPQAGRKRQFHQLGVEAIGPAAPAADAEAIALQQHLLDAWGLHGATFRLNTRGTPEDRVAVAAGLAAALQPHREQLCEDCRRRFAQNILRILDCKKELCGKIVDALPPVTEFMSAVSRQYLRDVAGLLEQMGVNFILDPRLVRGLDYYQHTVWEVRHAALGAQDALSGGGRYRVDIGATAVEGVGFAIGLERALMALQKQGGLAEAGPRCQVWLVAFGPAALAANLRLAQELRRQGIACGMDLTGRSMKSQMRQANRAGAPQAVIRGDQELQKDMVVLKNMADGSQQEVPAGGVVPVLQAKAATGGI